MVREVGTGRRPHLQRHFAARPFPQTVRQPEHRACRPACRCPFVGFGFLEALLDIFRALEGLGLTFAQRRCIHRSVFHADEPLLLFTQSVELGELLAEEVLNVVLVFGPALEEMLFRKETMPGSFSDKSSTGSERPSLVQALGIFMIAISSLREWTVLAGCVGLDGNPVVNGRAAALVRVAALKQRVRILLPEGRERARRERHDDQRHRWPSPPSTA